MKTPLTHAKPCSPWLNVSEQKHGGTGFLLLSPLSGHERFVSSSRHYRSVLANVSTPLFGGRVDLLLTIYAREAAKRSDCAADTTQLDSLDLNIRRSCTRAARWQTKRMPQAESLKKVTKASLRYSDRNPYTFCRS